MRWLLRRVLPASCSDSDRAPEVGFSHAAAGGVVFAQDTERARPQSCVPLGIPAPSPGRGREPAPGAGQCSQCLKIYT